MLLSETIDVDIVLLTECVDSSLPLVVFSFLQILGSGHVHLFGAQVCVL